VKRREKALGEKAQQRGKKISQVLFPDVEGAGLTASGLVMACEDVQGRGGGRGVVGAGISY